MKFEETERQQRCGRSKAWNLSKNIYKLKEEDTAAFYFPARRNGYSRLRQQKGRRKESLQLIQKLNLLVRSLHVGVVDVSL